MKFTFNWGTGITIAFIAFASFMLTLAYKSTQVQIDLVSDDYYEQEVAYQGRIESIRNAKQLAEPIKINFNRQTRSVDFQFPKVEGIDGKINFFRPSDAAQDKTLDIALNSNYAQSVAAEDFQGGHWRLKIEFESNGKRFYDEQTIYLP